MPTLAAKIICSHSPLRFSVGARGCRPEIIALTLSLGLFPSKNNGNQAGDYVDKERQESLLVPSAHDLLREEKII